MWEFMICDLPACSCVICYLVVLLFGLLVNRLSQIGGQPTTSLDQKQYPKYELSLCKCVYCSTPVYVSLIQYVSNTVYMHM